MRNIVVALSAAVVLTACDPVIRRFNVTPSELQCSGQVTVDWEITGPGGEMTTSKPVIPALPLHPPTLAGTAVVSVTETTQFSYIVPGAGHKHQTVKVNGTPNTKQLAFSGTCNDAVTAPLYNAITVSAKDAPGKLTSITTDADWPVHVFINGEVIALAPGGGPIEPMPNIPAAGTYTISIPGMVGTGICAELVKGGGPLGGGGSEPAPPINVFIKGSC